MSLARGFLPWIVLAAASATLGWQWGAAAAAVTAAVLILRDRQRGCAVDALTMGGVVYFAALALIAFAAPHSPLESYDQALASGWLALVAAGGVVLRRPFTLTYSRASVPPLVARSALFLRVNMAISTLWASSFALTAGALAACVALHQSTLLAVGIQVVGCVVPGGLTKAYVVRQRRPRSVTAAGPVGTVTRPASA